MSMGIWVNEGTPTMSFVLYTIHVEYMRDASYITCTYRQHRRCHVILARNTTCSSKHLKNKYSGGHFQYKWKISVFKVRCIDYLWMFSSTLCNSADKEK